MTADHPRLAGLTPAARRALDFAAVLGSEFELGVLARALGELAESVLAALAAPLALGLVQPVPGALRRFAFVDAPLRETLQGDLALDARCRVHDALARALESDGAAGDARLPLLAHHSFEAAQAGDPARAIV